MRIKVSIFLIIIFFSFCYNSLIAQKNNKNFPEWFIKPPKKSDKFLIAVSYGESGNKKLAINNAIANCNNMLDGIFEVKILGQYIPLALEENGLNEYSHQIFNESKKNKTLKKKKIIRNGELYRAFVLVKYPINEYKNALLKTAINLDQLLEKRAVIADKDLYLSSIRKYAKTIRIIENIRGNLTIDNWKIEYLQKLIFIYKKIIKLLINSNKNVELFKYLERIKARALLDILERKKIDFSEITTDEENFHYNLLIKHLEDLNKDIVTSQSKAVVDSLDSLRTNKRRELEEYEQQLYFNHPELKEKLGRGEPITLNRAQKMLGRDEAAIYYVLTEESLITIVLTRDKLEVNNESIMRDSLNTIVDTFLKGVDIKVLKWNKESSQDLYRLLIEPIKNYISSENRLCIIPDGKLNYIPFQALQNSETGKYLIEDYSIYYAPSLSTLSWLRLKGTYGSRDILAIGDPVFAEQEEISIAFRGKLISLPATEEEVLKLEKVYEPNAAIFLDSTATESNFKKNAADYGVLHFATHALVNEESPLYSSIAFSYEEEEDGFLEAREIMQMELNADLAVLSACQTAYGKVMKGEGMLGLTRAFFTAGVPSVVASLWNVEDRSTQELMVQFHAKLRDGERPADALREAQLYLLNNTQYTDPLFWAPFVLIGDSE